MKEDYEKEDVVRELREAAQFFARKNVSVPSSCFVHKLTKVKGMQRWTDQKGYFYEWDRLHGHVEVYNSRGKHLYVMDCNRNIIEKGVPGRKINVR